MLTKFPIKTEHGEYLVKLDDRKSELDRKIWTVRLYVLRTRPIFFSRYERVFTYRASCFKYKYYAERLNEFVMNAVNTFEERLSESFHHDINRELSLMDIEDWEVV